MITLAPLTAADLDLALSLERDPVVMTHLGGPRPREDIVEIHEHRLDLMAREEAWMYKVVLDDGSAAGTVGIWLTEWEGGSVHEMGWLLLPAFHGRGIGTEAARMVLDGVRDDDRFVEVHAFPATSNIASNRICEKLGFEMVGELPMEFADRLLRCNDWRLLLKEANDAL